MASEADKTGGLATARQFRVKWKPRVAQEFTATFRPLPHQQEVLRGLVSARRLGIAGGPALVLLTDERLCILNHYAFRFDRAIECPRGTITSVEAMKVLGAFSFFRLQYRTGDGLRRFDFGRVTAMSPAVAAIGWEPVAPEDLIAQLRSAWREDAPELDRV